MTSTATKEHARTASPAYAELIRRTQEAHLLESTAGLLGWDQEVLMPPRGIEHRSRQIALLARLGHQAATDPHIGELLAACEADGDLVRDPLSIPAVNVREIRHGYDRATKLPATLVEELAKVTSIAKQAWAEARQANDFARFRPWLEQVVALTRRAAECYGWDTRGERWDALAEGFEPGCTARGVAEVFAPLRGRLTNLVARIASRPGQDKPIALRVAPEQQMTFVRFVAGRIGFDFTRGRLDVSAHPFCGGTHGHDVRMTTRFHEDNFLDGLSSVMHESGHAIYEQGLPGSQDGALIGTPMDAAVSLSIHESQSRLWENQVGRSEAFWQWCLPELRKQVPAAAGLDVPQVYRSVNRVQPDFIRVEADEATYNLHIMIRFELERALIGGGLAVADLPGAWNAKYQEYLGLAVPDDARGCLQDIHWAMGAIGYFPTYTLGNLCAAQFFEQASADIPDLQSQIGRGEFDGLRTWLRTKIHSQAKRYHADRLCAVVTGRSLSAEPLLRHLEGKFLPLYNL
jgi:carboxypeptidase Taq